MQKSGAVKRVIAEICFVKMCDESMSTSNEALLLRLSKLEARVADGGISSPAPARTEVKTAEKAEKKAEIKPEAQAKPVQSSTPLKQESVQAPKRAAKPLKCWTEVIAKVAGLDVGAYAFLKKSRAYLTDDGKVRILVNAFSLFALDKPQIKNALAASLMQHSSVSSVHVFFSPMQ